MPDSRCLMVVNPAAGHGKAAQLYPEIVELCQPLFSTLDVQLTQAPGEARTLVQRALPGYQTILSLGGDGTAYEVLNGICATPYLSEIVLGTIPLGTGNSFLLDLGLSQREQVLEKIQQQSLRRVDIVKVTCGPDDSLVRYFRNILGVGFMAEVCRRTNQQLKFAGEMGYSLGVLLELLTLRNRPLTLTVDGQVHQLDNATLSLSNSRYTGGKMLIAPMADATDGLLDVIAINGVNRRSLLKAFQGIFDGSHIHHPNVATFKGRLIEIQTTQPQILMIDGEVDGTTPLRAEVLPQALQIYA